MNAAPLHRFAADAMLGRLARWLRVLGFDTTYDAAIADPALVRHTHEEGRILLTRDRRLLRELRPARAHEVRGEAPLVQLQALVAALALPAPAALFTRCLVDNTALPEPLPPGEGLRLVPPFSREAAGDVRRCPTCDRLYWHGSHVRRMTAALERVLPGWR